MQVKRSCRRLADEVTHAIQADITDADALEELGLGQFDTVVVATSSNLEVSILATVLLKRLGVRKIITKAATQLHGSILEQVGATRVVYPERETGLRLAHSFAAPGVRDYLDAAPGDGFARVGVAPSMQGKSLGELDLRKACGVTPIAVLRDGAIMLNPDRSEVLRARDDLIVAGLDEDLERLPGAGVDAEPR